MLGITQAEAMGLVSAVVVAQRETLVEHGGLLLRGLGTFRVVDHAESRARNPRTGESVVIPAHKRVKFRPVRGLREAVGDRS